MKMKSAIVPVFGGVFSALGMTAARRGRQFSKTVDMQLRGLDLDLLLKEFLGLENIGRAELLEEGVPEKSLRVTRSVDLCFSGQSYNLNVAWIDSSQAQADFESLHQQRYGYCHKTPVNVVNVRVSVTTGEPDFDLPERREILSKSIKTPGSSDTARHIRVNDMKPDISLSGPRVLIAYGTTIFVEEGWVAYLDKMGNIHLNTV
jgi:N-methylhydantoinase A